MKVAVIGTGYVGLVTGCCLAEAGHEVICIDNNATKVADMHRGVVPIYEPGLEELMHRGVGHDRLSFTTDLAAGISDATAIFLALPTPPQEDGSADLSAILAVAKELGKHLSQHYCVIIDKSTVPVGTSEKVQQAISEHATTEFAVVSNPEFLREGFAVQDFMEPERVVIGVTSSQAEAVMRELYASFISDERPLLVMDPATAELAKYAANSFLVTKISFMNEIAQLCERLGADVDQLRQAIGYDSRIGYKFLYPGIGYGGSCFPKDVRALKHIAEEHQYNFKLIDAALAVNKQQQHTLVDRVMDHFNGNIQGKTIAIWGLSFKPNTDDIREAPSLVIIDALLQAGAKITAYDPEAGDHVGEHYKDNKNVTVRNEKYAALSGATALVIATEWAEFIEADIAIIAKKLEQKLIFDGRNVFYPETMQAAGFSYYSIGRRPVLQTNM
jgi:UDPglucose 6-dehydrogenase